LNGPEPAASRLSHAYILSGPAGAARRAAADRLAMSYVCTGENPPCGVCSGCRKAAAGIHPDIVRVGEDGKDVNVAAVRALRSDAYILPNEAPRKVYQIENAGSMNASAQNAMLKLLEDGPPYAAFLLLAESDGDLLPTVRSRCETLRLDRLAGEAPDPALVEQSRTLAGLLLTGGELERMEYCVGLEKLDREGLAALLDQTVERLREGLLTSPDRKRALALTEHVKALRSALDFNVGPGHIAGWLCAGSMPGNPNKTR